MKLSILLLALTTTVGQNVGKHTQYGQVTERGGTRVAFWDNESNRSAGQVAIEYGRPPWKPAYEEGLDEMTSGKIWRLGQDFWTTLEGNVAIRVGGVDVPAGYYYLVVKRSADGETWSLAFVDPEATRRRGLDPFEVGTRAEEVPVRFEAPLTLGAGDAPEDRLRIELTEERLSIRWGTLSLSAAVEVAPR